MRRILTLAALLAIPWCAHARTVTLRPGDAGLRVEIDGQLFTEDAAFGKQEQTGFSEIKAAGNQGFRFCFARGQPTANALDARFPAYDNEK